MRGRRETNVAAGGKRANSNGGNPCKTYDETNRRFFIVLNKYREREEQAKNKVKGKVLSTPSPTLVSEQAERLAYYSTER